MYFQATFAPGWEPYYVDNRQSGANEWGVNLWERKAMPGFKSPLQKSVFENLITLILLAILAGVIGGGMVGLAMDHRASSSTSSGSLSAQ